MSLQLGVDLAESHRMLLMLLWPLPLLLALNPLLPLLAAPLLPPPVLPLLLLAPLPLPLLAPLPLQARMQALAGLPLLVPALRVLPLLGLRPVLVFLAGLPLALAPQVGLLALGQDLRELLPPVVHPRTPQPGEAGCLLGAPLR